MSQMRHSTSLIVWLTTLLALASKLTAGKASGKLVRTNPLKTSNQWLRACLAQPQTHKRKWHFS